MMHGQKNIKLSKLHFNSFLCKIVPVSKYYTTKTSASKRSLVKFSA